MAEPVIHNASATWVEGLRFLAVDPSKRALVLDSEFEGQPQTGHGPYQLFLAGVAGCTGSDVASVLLKKRQPLQGLVVEVRGTKSDDYPKRYIALHVTYRIKGAVTREAAERAVQLSMDTYCAALATFRAAGAAITHEIVLEGTTA